MMEPAAARAGVTDQDIVRAVCRRWNATDASVMRRTPWMYATSAPLELVTVALPDGSKRDLILKHLRHGDMSARARRAKPALVIDPQREIGVYARWLAPARIGPALVGFRCSPEEDAYWLLVERVAGVPLYEAGELETWCGVATWLATVHTRLSRLAGEPPPEARLIQYDRAWYTLWLDRACQFFASEDPAGSRRGRSALQWLADRYDKVIDRLLALPSVVIHGEFYPSNVLVARATDGLRMWPIDWEMAASGPGIIDLAALTAGEWREEDRRAVIAAYAHAAPDLGPARVDEAAETVAYAQIHLAVQWLGWFGRRRSASAHPRDWLSDAVDRAEALRL